ncbi:nicotinate-nucleotide adenylyltransferase [Pannonibacter indicus]|uniref:Probable nicotinate-nucleotide adenylyltransferase n=1 Tax=Pannonibacter indicus TaxID=466044 RepID=A0A0K6HPB3_9HYPH|nr:nicotinate-nucleotide adenylyltransferase [Pannonibacter indicus]CUA92755.1 nicotinate-nucleotide adenylyltransferase [Pannonibacter indicus]
MTSSATGRFEADPRWTRLPHAEPGNRIGLFGGSFNPAHSGHRLVAETALNRLKLDQVWWLVTPGNPLKDHGDLAPLSQRLEQAAALARHPRMKVTAIEARLGTAYTAETLARLKGLRPDLAFAWIMGADNLASFHRWQDWRGILNQVTVAVVNRPGASLSPLFAPAARAFARYRLAEVDAPLALSMKPPHWVFLHAPLDPVSSTLLRARQKEGL